jgi:hypothetical protein
LCCQWASEFQVHGEAVIARPAEQLQEWRDLVPGARFDNHLVYARVHGVVRRAETHVGAIQPHEPFLVRDPGSAHKTELQIAQYVYGALREGCVPAFQGDVAAHGAQHQVRHQLEMGLVVVRRRGLLQPRQALTVGQQLQEARRFEPVADLCVDCLLW